MRFEYSDLGCGQIKPKPNQTKISYIPHIRANVARDSKAKCEHFRHTGLTDN